MKYKFTHVGHLIWDDPTPHVVVLRETKTLWVTRNRNRYRKRDGMPPSEPWPRSHLELGSIKPIKETE